MKHKKRTRCETEKLLERTALVFFFPLFKYIQVRCDKPIFADSYY